MRRAILVLTMAIVMAAMMAASALPAMADIYYYCEYYYDGSYECIWFDDGF